MTDLDVFMARVVVDEITGCWLWHLAPDVKGYGKWSLRGRTVFAHRASYAMLVGPIPPGMQVGHVCHDSDLSCPGGVCEHRLCVNPDHLALQTNEENSRASGRLGGKVLDRCKRGHPLTDSNVYRWGNGKRRCAACRSERHEGPANASKTHCPQGHPYDEANTYVRDGRRNCRACSKARSAARRARKAAA